MQAAPRIPPDQMRSIVAERYSRIGDDAATESTIPAGRAWALALGYPADVLESVPSVAVDAFTGIGTPILAATLQPGDRVLDLGCGAGMDSVLAARRVGPRGWVYGVDLAPGMIANARRAILDAGLTTVSVVEAAAEELPLSDRSIDVALVNGLFNLAPEKPPVAAELARVVRPGGHLVGAEIVITDGRPPAEPDLEDWFR